MYIPEYSRIKHIHSNGENNGESFRRKLDNARANVYQESKISGKDQQQRSQQVAMV